MTIWRNLAVLTLAALLEVAPSAASELPTATGPVLLTVDGAVDRLNTPTGADWDRAMLEALPQMELRTSTAWTEGVASFRGPLVRDVLAAVGADGEEVRAFALNDYWVVIPTIDFIAYDVILALSQDGKPLSRRDKGPIWIVYPRDEYPALQTAEYNDRWIWQLRRFTVR